MLGLAVLSEMDHLGNLGLLGVVQLVVLLSSWSVSEKRQSESRWREIQTSACILRIMAAATACGLAAVNTGRPALDLFAAALSPPSIFAFVAGFLGALLSTYTVTGNSKHAATSVLATRAVILFALLLTETSLELSGLRDAKENPEGPTLIAIVEQLVAIMIAIWILARRSR